ncbi:MAG: hypothetical protein R6W31_12335 [Bacteroidales bacterium]
MMVKSTLISLCLISFSFTLVAQDSIQFSPEDLHRIGKRWSKYHPRAEVFLHNGDTLIGQPINFDMAELLLFSSDSLPMDLEGKLVSIPFADINKVDLDRGGPVTPGLTSGIIVGISAGIAIGFGFGSPGAALILGNAMGVLGGLAGKGIHHTATIAELELDSYRLNYNEELKKLHEWSVFRDSILFTDDMNQLVVHSAAIRRLYPRKHLRISFALNWGFNTLENEMLDAVSSSGLPSWQYFRHTSMGFEYLDLSWRFNNHWIVGGGFMSNYEYLASADYYSGFEDGSPYFGYNYSVDITDYRIYMEYAISPVNRFITERSEFLVGGGFIISSPGSDFWYNYMPDPATGVTEAFGSHGPNAIFGFQARAAGQYYLFRNFSLSGGVEMNLYQNLHMPALELPNGETVLDAHVLNYSTVRFKLGAHLYF